MLNANVCVIRLARMEWFLALADLGTLTFLGVLGARFAKEALPEQRTMWARVAEKYGGEHQIGPSDHSARDDQIMVGPAGAGQVVT